MQTGGPQIEKIARLSAGQRDVLELVALYMSSKQIARTLGISPNAVDTRLKRTLALLGVNTRADAARMFRAYAESEGLGQSEACGKLVAQSSDLAQLPNPFHQDGAPGEWNPSGAEQAGSLRQHQADYLPGLQFQNNARSFLSVLSEANRTNDLSPIARLIVIAGLMIIAVISAGAVISLVEGMSRLV